MSFKLNIDKFLNSPAWEVETGKGVRVSRRWERRVLSGLPTPVVEMDSVFNGHLSADEAIERAKAVTDAAFIAKQIEGMAPEIEARFYFQERKRAMRAERRHVEEKPKLQMPTLTAEQATNLAGTLRSMLGNAFRYGRHEQWGKVAQVGARHIESITVSIKDKPGDYTLSLKGNGLYIRNYRYNRNRCSMDDFIYALTGNTRRDIKITMTGHEATEPYTVANRWDPEREPVLTYTKRLLNEPLTGRV